jgi:hypothetical protein
MTQRPFRQAPSSPDLSEPAKRRRHLPLWLLVVGTTGALMAAVAQREAIVRTAPASARIYAMIGLPVNLSGLAFRGVTSKLLDASPQPVLMVSGEIANARGARRRVPDLRLVLRGSDGREIYTWTAPAPKSNLEAGETVAFRARLAAPPEGVREIAVRFADMREKGER